MFSIFRKNKWVYDGITRYRIITCERRLYERWLQFYWNGKWRFVPEERYINLHGYWLYPEDAPCDLGWFGENDNKVMGNFFGYDYIFKSFAESYPDITKYFDRHRKIRELRRKVPDVVNL